MKRLLSGILVMAPLSIFAQGYQLNLQGTRQIGKGSTGLADPTDATAVFTNPGSMAFLSANDITVGITGAISSGTFTDANSNEVFESDNPLVTPFNASVAYGKEKSKFKFGLSVYTPFGSTMRWQDGAAGRFETKEISLISITAQPTVSYRINSKLGLGVGLMYTYGHVQIKKDLPVQFGDGRFGTADIDCKANGFGVNAGLYFAATDKLFFALTYRSRQNMNSSTGTATFDVPASLASNFPSQNVNAVLPLPQVFGIGASYKANKNWTVNLEGYLSDWSKYDTIKIHFEEAAVAGAMSSDLIREYKQGVTVRAGVEYKSNKKYELRAGAFYSKSPIQEGYLNPDVPDANRINPSIGASYNFSDKFRMDAALLAEFVTREDHNVISGIHGTYKFNILLPSIGLTYKL
jgi:long-chain fatty acid transport protein